MDGVIELEVPQIPDLFFSEDEVMIVCFFFQILKSSVAAVNSLCKRMRLQLSCLR